MTTFGPYPAKIVPTPDEPTGWHDGDTCYLDVDVGWGFRVSAVDFDDHVAMSCRIYGINAPELKSAGGSEAANHARSLAPVGTRVTVVSHSWDKFGGRFDGDVFLPDGSSLADRMLEAGQAVKYP